MSYTKHWAWKSYRRWVPRLLTVEQKRNCMTTSKYCLDMFKHNPKEFLRRFVTVDETWIHITHQKRKNNLNSGLNPANLLQRRQKRFHRAERSWLPFFGIREASFHRLFGEEKDNHGIVLCWFIGSIRRWIEEKTASFSEKKSALSLW